MAHSSSRHPFRNHLFFNVLDRFLISEMHQWGIPVLRVALGIVFLWFGGLKVFGVTPVADLIAQTYSFFPTAPFIMVLVAAGLVVGGYDIAKKKS